MLRSALVLGLELLLVLLAPQSSNIAIMVVTMVGSDGHDNYRDRTYQSAFATIML